MRKIVPATLMGGLALALIASPAAAADNDATVSVLHGVPGMTVDVYINGEEAIPDFMPGKMTDPMMLAAGEYDIEVYADGQMPGSAEPAISAEDLMVPAGANLTLAAYLSESGDPMLKAFTNDVSHIDSGEARLTVRHIAAAPTVDVRADGMPVIEDLMNPNEKMLDVEAMTISADVTLAGTDTVVLGPEDLDLAEGTSTIVYAWGSAEEGTLDMAVQMMDGMHTDPWGIPSGEGGAAPTAALIALAAAGLAGAGLAGRYALRSSRATA